MIFFDSIIIVFFVILFRFLIRPRIGNPVFSLIKFSVWQGIQHYEKKNYHIAIYHIERVVKIYPKSIGRFHILLGKMYLENGELSKAQYYAQKAQEINPDHNAPKELLDAIDKSLLE